MLSFTKYVAAGNDFIVCEIFPAEIIQIERLCDRRWGIGADGLIWIEGNFVGMVVYRCPSDNPSGAEGGFSGNFKRNRFLESSWR